MIKMAISLGLIFVVYFIGYAVGRKDVVDDIREMTKELKEMEANERSSNRTNNQQYTDFN